MRTRAGFLVLLAAILVVGASSAAPTATPKPLVWFSPWPSGDEDNVGSVDYMDLFARNAPWSQAASRVHIFKLPATTFFSRLTPARLKRIVSDLKRRHIALGVEVAALPSTLTPRSCGAAVEGFNAVQDPAFILASKIINVGGTLAYAAIDNPYYFGHVYDGPDACHWSPWKIAKELGRYVKRLRGFFPKLVIGNIEGLGNGISSDELVRWMDTYKRATRTRLGFLHIDLDYGTQRWAQEVHKVQDAAHARGIPFGLIYIGEPGVGTDEDWSALAEQRFVEYEAKEGIRPDHAILQSWNDKPDRVLPETTPYTFTWLVNRYFRTRTKVSFQAEGSASGKLTDAEGKPLAELPVELTATALDGPGSYAEYTVTGTVPAGAGTAIVGYRVNTECGCSGSADFTLYESRYQEQGGPNRVPNARFDQGLDGWGTWGDGLAVLEPSGTGGQALHVAAAPNQVAAINSSDFSVTPGQRFAVTFGARVSPSSADSGYFTVMFIGATTELDVPRSTINLAAAQIALGKPATNAQGAFSTPFPSLPSGSYLVEAWFRGDDVRFPAYASARLNVRSFR